MADKFNWNLNPNSPDFQKYLNLEINDAAACGDQEPEPAGAAALLELVNPPQASNFPEPINPMAVNIQQPSPAHQILDPVDGADDTEFFMNSGMEGNSLPNDDVWKKFDLCEGLTNRGPIDPFRDCYDDLPWLNPMAIPLRNEASEIRNHDCMWAGLCISEKHDTNNHNLNRINYFPLTPPGISRSEDTELMALTTPEGPAFADRPSTRRNAVVAPTHARSVLLPSRVVSSTATTRRPSHTVTTSFRVQRSRTLDSGGDSPRPETPQSLTDNEDLNMDLADMKAVEDLVADSFGYNFISDMVLNMGSEGSGYDLGAAPLDKNQQKSSAKASTSAAPTRGTGTRGRRNAARQEAPVARHYTDHSLFSDHCYHLSKNTRMDNLGVQTPSDSGGRRSVSAGPAWFPASENVVIQYESSEEEIDVETVYAEMRKPTSRSSSTGSNLPTNPSFSDRQQIQLSVATAISKKEAKRSNPRAGPATQARNSGAGSATQARNSGAGPSTQARNSGAGDRTVNQRATAGTKRRGNSQRNAGAARQAPEEQNQEAQAPRQAKRRRCENDDPAPPPPPPRTGRTNNRRTGRCNGRSTTSSDSEVDSVERRSIHNSMERQRRVDLRNSFEELRKLVPRTAANEKAAKVLILRSAADYCKALTLEDLEMIKAKAELRRLQELLLARVSQLRRSLAARR